MSHLTEDTTPVPTECPRCGEPITPHHFRCPACGLSFTESDPHDNQPEDTGLRPPPQAAWPRGGHGPQELPPHAGVILQFLPSGACVSLLLNAPVILGRETDAVPEHIGPADVVSLSPYNAARHGVSRQHCILRRHGTQLTVADMGTTNGTLLNGESLAPGEEYVVGHGDKLILGTLHIIVAFNLL